MLEWVLNQLGPWLEARRRRQDHDDAAIRAILLAVNETKAYIADTEGGLSASRDRERLLVQLWTEAAVAVRRSDPRLAERLQMKAGYWADPRNWDDHEIRRAQIGIDAVAEEARLLLTSANRRAPSNRPDLREQPEVTSRSSRRRATRVRPKGSR